MSGSDRDRREGGGCIGVAVLLSEFQAKQQERVHEAISISISISISIAIAISRAQGQKTFTPSTGCPSSFKIIHPSFMSVEVRSPRSSLLCLLKTVAKPPRTTTGHHHCAVSRTRPATQAVLLRYTSSPIEKTQRLFGPKSYL